MTAAGVRLACDCGATIFVAGGDEAVNAVLIKTWEISHNGRGHGRCTAAEARDVRWAGRRKADSKR